LLAAEDRYREAEEMLIAHEFDGAVYLLGYAVEMWLKASCLRLRGHGPMAPVKAALTPLRKWMATVAPSVAFTDYHDLFFFAECVTQLRLLHARPLTGTLAAELRSEISNGLHNEWTVEMRYRHCGLGAADAWAALLQAWWLKTNWAKLL
jgi:hypothetical protein